MHAHVCQDDYGLWFVTLEHDDGTLELIEHNAPKEHATDTAWVLLPNDFTVEEERVPFPPGGIVPGGLPDGYKPEPRRVAGG